MKAPSPAFSLYPKDILGDVNCAAMSNEEFGCYMRLLCHAWLEGSIPSEPVRLARILKVRHQTFLRLWPSLEPCFSLQDGRLVQKRMEQERYKQRERSETMSARGRKGGRPAKSTKDESLSFRPRKPTESLPSPSPSPSPSPTTEEQQQCRQAVEGESEGETQRTPASPPCFWIDHDPEDPDQVALVARVLELEAVDAEIDGRPPSQEGALRILAAVSGTRAGKCIEGGLRGVTREWLLRSLATCETLAEENDLTSGTAAGG